MSRDVTIQLLDIVDAGYPKQMLEKEPVLLRRSEIVRQVKNGSVNITNETQRLAISKTSEVHNSDISMLTANNVMQIATVKDVQTVYDKVVDVSQGFIDVTVKYGLIFSMSGTSPYYVNPIGYPVGTTFVSGDLAIAPFDAELIWGREWYSDAGDRNGIIPIAGSAPLTGQDYVLYRYNGTGWLPCVLDTKTGISKYRVKVQNDYAYLCNVLDDTNIGNYPNIGLLLADCTNVYNLIYYPNSPSAGITRSVRLIGNARIDWRIGHMKKRVDLEMSNFYCGDTESN